MIHDDAFEIVAELSHGKSARERRIIAEVLEALDDGGLTVTPEEHLIVTRDAGDVADLPVPRLQFRWEEDGEYCHYELVLRLSEWDIRREKGGEETEKRSRNMAVPLGLTRVGGGRPERGYLRDDGSFEVDTPYRDGNHARWDGEQLGLPIYAIFGDRISKVEPVPKPALAS